MPRRARLPLVLVLALGCAPPAHRDLTVGTHRVRVVPPPGWEILEHGRRHHFRSGEMEITLSDLGPVSQEGLIRELSESRGIWLQGRRRDAVARVQGLQGAPLRLASSDQRLAFWRTWWEVATDLDRADSAAIGYAFDDLVAGAGRLPKAPPEVLVEYVLERWPDAGRREIAHQTRRPLNGREWVEVETWDRLSHMNPREVALLEDRGSLLVLAIERGPIEVTGPIFETLLSGLEVLPDSAGARRRN